MHVVISGMFWNQPTVGSGQYLHGLVGALPRVAPEHRYTLLVPAYQGAARQAHARPEGAAAAAASGILTQPEGEAAAGEGASPDAPQVALHTVRTPFDGRDENLAKLWYEQVGAPLAAARLRGDVLHVPYFAPPLWAPLPVVATVLDIIPLRLPEYRRRPSVRAYVQLVARAARRTPQIIAISDHAWGEIIAYLRYPPERLTTVPLAPAPHFRPQERAAELVAQRYGLERPFVYYVGGLDARKNVATLVRAFGRMRRSGAPPAMLAIAGRAAGTDAALFPDLDAVIADEGIGPLVRRIDVPWEDGPLLYSAATVFAYPSRYEGFGLPPLEALACGVPVVASCTSSLPEVVGDAGLLCDPHDPADIARQMAAVLDNPALAAQLREAGPRRAAQFSWRRTARETLAAYERAAAERAAQAAGRPRF